MPRPQNRSRFLRPARSRNQIHESRSRKIHQRQPGPPPLRRKSTHHRFRPGLPRPLAIQNHPPWHPILHRRSRLHLHPRTTRNRPHRKLGYATLHPTGKTHKCAVIPKRSEGPVSNAFYVLTVFRERRILHSHNKNNRRKSQPKNENTPYFTSSNSFSFPEDRSSIFFVSACDNFSNSSRHRFRSSSPIFLSFSSFSTASFTSRRTFRKAVL